MLSTRNITSSVPRVWISSRPQVVTCRALKADPQEPSSQGRRTLLASGAAFALYTSFPDPSFAAYGDAANVFGKVTRTDPFIPYVGDGFAVRLPSKWIPSKEVEHPGTILRYSDNYFPVNHVDVLAQATDKKKITDFGPPEKFVDAVGSLLGRQSYAGETKSEGGFAPNRVSAASLMAADLSTDQKGKEYYTLRIFTRTADGTEGGKHHMIKATVADGKLWVLNVEIGDKRWIRGQDKEAQGVVESFSVA